MAGFTHLHVHTQYSLLDGAARIDDLVKAAKAQGMQALAITDHGVMYGVIDFYKACVAEGIKPILGMEAYIAPLSMDDRMGAREYAHLILLAKNQKGYKNLMQLASLAFTKGYYYKPRIDYTVLEQYGEGLVCLSACLSGGIPSLLMEGKAKEAEELAARLKRIFGPDFYIELQNHGLPEQLRLLPELKALAAKLDIKVVATNDVHYVRQSDAEAQDVLLCIQTNRFVDETDRMKMSAEEFYLKSEQEMRQLFYDCPEAIANSMEIAQKCDVTIKFGERHLPGFTAPNGMDNAEFLKHLCMEGLKRKLPDAPKEAYERLEYERSVIEKMCFVDYFLIVWDFIHFAKTNGIQVGPGRGSGAGSLVAYCMDITDVNPLKYNLLFERFLNPERISMPDFDVDFCYERRQEVIDYVVSKYGEDHVAQIITFGTMAARAAIRDVGRVLRMPYGEVDRIAKLVPGELNMTLTHALQLSPELKTLYETSEAVKKLIDLALKLEGLPRHASTHAAGVVISAHPITEYVPLQKNDEAVTTQFTMGTLEELGLLKMDFLGLRTLTVIRDTLDFIAQGGKPVPDLQNMEFDDPEVYAMIARGDTDGVFQLESAGMRQFLMQLKPDNFEDIIAGIALFRPGPMEQIPKYISCKNSGQKISYLHEKLRPILSTTYGCMVYQEQVMQIVRDLAGYSYGRSDLVRRAMSKKKHDVMAKEREYFIYGIEEDGKVIVPGAVRNGVSADIANRIFDEMMDFASYAFNKSHAAAYAVVSYRTAYLKLYYPVEFMTALINSYLGSADKVAEYVYSCDKHGIKVLRPDINKSRARFSVENGAIRFGLAAVRNVGEAAIAEIIAEREQNGKFTDFHDFLRRSANVNKRMVEGLIKAGCFDDMNVRRAQLMAVYERAMDAAANDRKQQEQGQISLFDLAGATPAIAKASNALPDIPEFNRSVLLSMEREAIGIYISGHPLMEYEHVLKHLGTDINSVLQADGTGMLKDNARIKLGGIIASVKTKPTKSGSGLMGYVTLEDMTGAIEVTVFPSLMIKYSSFITPERPVLVTGRLSMREDQNNTLLLDEIVQLSNDLVPLKLYIRFNSRNMPQKEKTMAVLRRFPGNIPVIIYDETINKKRMVPRDLYINNSAELMDTLRQMLGSDNVKAV